MLIGATAVPAVAAQPQGPGDVTASTIGQGLAGASAQRFSGHGVQVKASDLRVVEDAAGYLVVRAGTVLEDTDVKSPTTAAGPLNDSGGGPGALAPMSDSWVLQANDCFSRVSDTFSWIDHCYKLYKDSETSNGTKDFFLLQHFATAGPNSPWAIYSAKISSNPASNSAAMAWVDWSPKGSWSGSSCSSGTIGVTAPISLTANVTFCEHWDMNKANPAVNYWLQWWTGPTGIHETRGIDYMNTVSVAQGKWPVWLLPAEVHGSTF